MTDDTLLTIQGRTADLLALVDVKRWVVIKTSRTQSVAEHSFAVAIIAMELSERLSNGKVGNMAELLWWALVHDVPETLTGDVDGKFKREFPAVRSALVEAEDIAFPWYKITRQHVIPMDCQVLVKMADKIEAIAFITHWGIGPRADEVMRELTVILMGEMVRHAAQYFSLEEGFVRDHVRDLLHHSTTEQHSIQMRGPGK